MFGHETRKPSTVVTLTNSGTLLANHGNVGGVLDSDPLVLLTLTMS